MKISNLPQATIITDDDIFVIVDNLSAFEKQTKQTTAETLSNYIIDQVPNEIFEYSSASSFPIEGSAGNLYVSLDNNIIYRWDDTDSEYVAISSSLNTTDAVEQYADFASLPLPGQSNKIYVVESDNLIYRWSGAGVYAEYVQISSNVSQAGNITLVDSTISSINNEDLILNSSTGKLSITNGSFIKKHTFILKNSTTGSQTKFLTLDGLSPGVNNSLSLPTKCTWNYDIKVSAYNETDEEGAIFNFRGGIQRKSDGSTSLISEDIEEEWKSASLQNCTITISATSVGYLNVLASGTVNKNIQWMAVADVCEIKFN